MPNQSDMKTEITYISPHEIDEATQRIASIRFDSLVRMFDVAKPHNKVTPLQPQWFKSELKLTMELIEDSDPYLLGRIIKDAYFELKKHIEQYEYVR